MNHFISKNKIHFEKQSNNKYLDHFVKSVRSDFIFYDNKKILKSLRKLLYLVKSTHRKNAKILFVGLSPEDTNLYLEFNNELKTLALEHNHLYIDFLKEGRIYDYYSFFKRKKPSGKLSNPFKKLETPSLVLFFSKSSKKNFTKEYSWGGIPSISFLSSDSGMEHQDYLIFGVYSKRMLTFYLKFIYYCFANSKKSK
jgi:hypothetical protein